MGRRCGEDLTEEEEGGSIKKLRSKVRGKREDSVLRSWIGLGFRLSALERLKGVLMQEGGTWSPVILVSIGVVVL